MTKDDYFVDSILKSLHSFIIWNNDIDYDMNF
jgi:hypothetical protein